MFEPLAKHHDKQAFDCGNDDINRYLKMMASQHAKKGIARTHVLADGATIKAFYTLSTGLIDNSQKLINGYPHQIPCIIIGRIGVDSQYQGQGLSKIAIAHALQMIKQISRLAGVAFTVIDAKDEHLASYYERLGFVRINGGLKLVYPVSHI